MVHPRGVRLWLCLMLIGCGASQLEMRGAPPRPFDAVIVPGCPSEDDGALSLCQKSRVLWAFRLWERGWTRNFITSGAAVYSPYVEAEALAAGLAALGVPPEHIWLEPNALHTDENMYYSLQLARALGFHRIAVASDGAAWDCRMLVDWGQMCKAFTTDRAWVRARHLRVPGVLERVHSTRVADFIPRAERERQIAERTGRHRPPSYLLYLELGLMRLNGERWVPPGMPDHPTRTRWSDRLSGR